MTISGRLVLIKDFESGDIAVVRVLSSRLSAKHGSTGVRWRCTWIKSCSSANQKLSWRSWRKLSATDGHRSVQHGRAVEVGLVEVPFEDKRDAVVGQIRLGQQGPSFERRQSRQISKPRLR